MIHKHKIHEKYKENKKNKIKENIRDHKNNLSICLAIMANMVMWLPKNSINSKFFKIWLEYSCPICNLRGNLCIIWSFRKGTSHNYDFLEEI